MEFHSFVVVVRILERKGLVVGDDILVFYVFIRLI